MKELNQYALTTENTESTEGLCPYLRYSIFFPCFQWFIFIFYLSLEVVLKNNYNCSVFQLNPYYTTIKNTDGQEKTQSIRDNHGKHGKHGKVVPVPPLFRVFRAFSGSNSLMLCIIAGTEELNQDALTTENTENTERTVPALPLFRVFRAFSGLFLYFICYFGAFKKNYDYSIFSTQSRLYNTGITERLCPCLLSSVFSVLSVVITH